MRTRGNGSARQSKKQPMTVEERVEVAFEEGTPIDEAANEACREAIRQHKQSGQPMVVWRDGKTVLLPAEQVEAELNGGKGGNGRSVPKKRRAKKR
jgi:hypothetical protein